MIKNLGKIVWNIELDSLGLDDEISRVKIKLVKQNLWKLKDLIY